MVQKNMRSRGGAESVSNMAQVSRESGVLQRRVNSVLVLCVFFFFFFYQNKNMYEIVKQASSGTNFVFLNRLV